MPTVVQTANDLLNPKFNQIRPKNDTFSAIYPTKKTPKIFRIVRENLNNVRRVRQWSRCENLTKNDVHTMLPHLTWYGY